MTCAPKIQRNPKMVRLVRWYHHWCVQRNRLMCEASLWKRKTMNGNKFLNLPQDMHAAWNNFVWIFSADFQLVIGWQKTLVWQKLVIQTLLKMWKCYKTDRYVSSNKIVIIFKACHVYINPKAQDTLILSVKWKSSIVRTSQNPFKSVITIEISYFHLMLVCIQTFKH